MLSNVMQRCFTMSQKDVHDVWHVYSVSKPDLLWKAQKAKPRLRVVFSREKEGAGFLWSSTLHSSRTPRGSWFLHTSGSLPHPSVAAQKAYCIVLPLMWAISEKRVYKVWGWKDLAGPQLTWILVNLGISIRFGSKGLKKGECGPRGRWCFQRRKGLREPDMVP